MTNQKDNVLKIHKDSILSRKSCYFGALFILIFILPLVAISFYLYNQSNVLNDKLPSQFVSDVLRISKSLITNEYVSLKNSRKEGNKKKVISCYYNFPRLSGNVKDLLPSGINPHLCTHINVGFASVKNKTVFMEEEQKEHLKQVVNLRTLNSELKVLLSIGGSRNDNGFSDMVINHASRKTFIRSVKSLLRNYTLDGIDLDWEFPAIHEVDSMTTPLSMSQTSSAKKKKYPRERQHFSQLLREIRVEYLREKRNYLLTVAVAAQQTIVDASYDVDQINLYADYANIMTYDFHTYTRYTPFTGLNSPLYKRKSENTVFETLNINYTVQMYLSKGLDSNKIVVGIPTYGHTFHLVNPENANIGSPADGYGGVSSSGFVDYSQVCEYVNFHNKVTIVMDPDAKVPYLYWDQDWISYDSQESVAAKAKFINSNNLRGAMIYSLNADDYSGVCEMLGLKNGSFPLLETVKSAINGNVTNV